MNETLQTSKGLFDCTGCGAKDSLRPLLRIEVLTDNGKRELVAIPDIHEDKAFGCHVCGRAMTFNVRVGRTEGGIRALLQ